MFTPNLRRPRWLLSARPYRFWHPPSVRLKSPIALFGTPSLCLKSATPLLATPQVCLLPTAVLPVPATGVPGVYAITKKETLEMCLQSWTCFWLRPRCLLQRQVCFWNSPELRLLSTASLPMPAIGLSCGGGHRASDTRSNCVRG